MLSRELLAQVEEKPHLLIECCFCVVNKKRRTVPFFFNEVQRDFIDKIETQGREKPYFVLKGRQQGFTTLITAIQLCHAIICKNFSGFTVADREDNTKAIFLDKAKSMLQNLPKALKPKNKLNSANELFFDKLNSSWRVSCASANVGRSRTLSFIHFSEAAFYRCGLSELQQSILEAATEDALCIYETTANGFNAVKELWDSGTCHNLFYEWWKTSEYRCNDLSYLETDDKWLRERLKILKEKGLCPEQMAWYAKKYKSYIDKSSIKQEYPCTADEAFLVSGECVFDKDAISNYLSKFDVKSTLGAFKYEKSYVPLHDSEGGVLTFDRTIHSIEFVPSENGYISIVEEPYSVLENGKLHQHPYVIGADTAGEGDDYFTAKVIDNITGRCVATLRKQRMDEDLFAEQLYCLGKYYNNALIGIEINYSRYPVKVLLELGYDNQFSQAYYNRTPSAPERRYGFLTSCSTRSIIISNLVVKMRESLELETDRETLKELCTFIVHPNGKKAAALGSHDDLVMASAIANQIAQTYVNQMQIIDTGSGDFEKNFSLPKEEPNQFMEW